MGGALRRPDILPDARAGTATGGAGADGEALAELPPDDPAWDGLPPEVRGGAGVAGTPPATARICWPSPTCATNSCLRRCAVRRRTPERQDPGAHRYLPNLSQDAAKAAIEAAGGKVTGSVSKKRISWWPATKPVPNWKKPGVGNSGSSTNKA